MKESKPSRTRPSNNITQVSAVTVEELLQNWFLREHRSNWLKKKIEARYLGGYILDYQGVTSIALKINLDRDGFDEILVEPLFFQLQKLVELKYGPDTEVDGYKEYPKQEIVIYGYITDM